MPATSGPTSPKQFAFYDRDASCWRTWPAISLWGSETFSGTWPKQGTTQGGDAFELPTSAPPTAANESSSSLPTPTARDYKGRNQRDDATCLPGAVALLPTPAAQEPGGTIEQYRARFKDGRTSTFVPLGMIGDLLPTPTAWLGRRPAHGDGDAERWKDPERSRELSDFIAWLGDPTSPPSDAGNTSPDPHPDPPTTEVA